MSAEDAEAFDKAVLSHDFDNASKLLLKINIETIDYNGNTYLMKASVKNDVEAFKWLVQNGANINARDKSGKNALFNAINSNSLDIVQLLVTDKKLLHTIYRGDNPLHAAVSVGQLGMVKLLVNAGIDPDAQNHFNVNAFDLAQVQSDKEILEWLLTDISFKILDEAQNEETKITTLESLFAKHGFKYLNLWSDERHATIAEYAAERRQIKILKWLKSKNILVDESSCKWID